MEGRESSVCVVCAKGVSSLPVSIHSGLVAQNGSVHSKIGQVVGVDELTEACKASQHVCQTCFRLLLNIVNLEYRVVLLKNEFRNTFQRGAESRRIVLAGGQVPQSDPSSLCDGKTGEVDTVLGGEWDGAGMGQCDGSDKGERFLSNIPLGSNSNREPLESNGPPAENIAQESRSPMKYEGASSDSAAVDIQQCTEGLGTRLTFGSTRDVNELLPSHCLLGGDMTPYSSQGEDETLKDMVKRSQGDGSMQDYPISPSSDASNPMTSTEDMRSGGGVGEDASSTVNTEHKQVNNIPELGEGDGDLTSEESALKNPPQGRLRRSSKSKQEQTTWCSRSRKHKRKKPNSGLENIEVKVEVDAAETEERWMGRESGAAQLDGLLLTCELCGERFSDAKQLGRHRGEVHSSIYCHVCHWCPDTCYREKSKLTLHLRRIHKITAHQCPGCEQQAVSQNALDQHIISHHPESRFFECHICHKAFRTHRYLHFVHIKRCHYGLPIKYSCEKCQKGFVDKSSFENHKVTHSKARNFTCEFCGARFLTPYALKVHVNTHTHEKKYVCEDCGSAFLRMCNLCAHKKRFHSSDDVKLVCEICGKSMATRKDLRRHQLAQHSKEKPFSCNQCARSYTAKESLKSHLRTHTGEKPYVCECGKAFHKSNVLRRHQRSVHDGEDLQQDTVRVQDGTDSVQVGNEDMSGEEHMVVITLKECNPPAVYTVQSGSPHLEEILVSGEAPTQSESEVPLVTEDAGLPLIHPQLGALGRGRLAISTPVLFTTLNTGSITVHQQQQHEGVPGITPDTSFTTEVATVDSGLPVHPTSSAFQQSPGSPDPAKGDPDPLASFAPTSCTSVPPQLLQLPALHTTTAPVSFVTPWHSSPL